MFTGLIEDVGTVESRRGGAGGRAAADRDGAGNGDRPGRLGRGQRRLPHGDGGRGGGFETEAMNQTLEVTALGALEAGAR